VSVLSRTGILRRMKRGDLVVSPVLGPEQLGPSSVDLRAGNVFLTVRARGLSHVDPRDQWIAQRGSDDHSLMLARRQKHERFELPFGRPFLLHPGMLALIPTLEWIKLPQDLQGLVTARSCWAREGLSIATATLINPSYRGIITLELANLGQIPIKLYPGLRIAQIAFHRLDVKQSAGTPSQFDDSFDPTQGNIVKDDQAFLGEAPPQPQSSPACAPAP
jgi:dCTP deaminase